jgi:tetratricopeptide (TPR) repeat protein
MARAVFLNPGDPRKWYHHVLLTLLTGDRTCYRVICQALLARFRRNKTALVAADLAWTCSLGPDAVADPARVVALAQEALAQEPGNANYLTILGAALYRAGDFHGARQRLDEAAKVHGPEETVWDWLFLAMTYHQLGQPQEARRWLDQAVRALDRAPLGRPLPGAAVILNWDQCPQLRLLREEATLLLHPK